MYKLLFTFLIFSEWFELNLPGFNYWDEAAVVIVLLHTVWTFLRSGRRNVKLKDVCNWLCLLGMVILGMMGNLLHPGIQENFVVVIKDIVAFSKFFIIIFAFQLNEVEDEKQKKILADAAILSRAFVLIIFAAAIIAYPSGTLFYTGEIRTVKCFQFIFSHPTFLVSSCVMMATVLIADSTNKNRAYLLLDCVILFLAQRTKGYIGILAIVLICILGRRTTTKWVCRLVPLKKKQVFSKKIWIALFFVGIVAVLTFHEKISEYVNLGMTSARIVLYVIGFKIAAEFFPLGSGFGTFASYLSGESYSNIYEMYGISSVRGMTREYYGYLSDTFWPYVFGQLGLVGLVCYISLLCDAIKAQLKQAMNYDSIIAVLFAWRYVLFASVVEAYFTNSSGVQFALIISIFAGVRSRSRRENKI